MRPLLRTQTLVLHVLTQEFGSCQSHSGAAAVSPHWDPTPLARPQPATRHMLLTDWLDVSSWVKHLDCTRQQQLVAIAMCLLSNPFADAFATPSNLQVWLSVV